MKRNNVLRGIFVMMACLLILQALPNIGLAAESEYTVTINNGGGQSYGNVDTTNFSYTVQNVTAAGVYQLKASLKESASDVRDGYIKFRLGNQYATHIYSSPGVYSEQTIGYLYLEEGDNQVQISNHARGGYDNYPWCESFSLTYCEGFNKEDYVTYGLEAEKSTTNISYIQDYLGNEEMRLLNSGDKYCTFSFNAPTNGKYKIVANARTSTTSKNVEGTIDVTGYSQMTFAKTFAKTGFYEDVDLGEFNMLSGENTFTVKTTSGNLYLDYCTVKKIEDYIPDTSLGENGIILAKDKISSAGMVNEVEGNLEMVDASVVINAETRDYCNYMLSLNCKGTPNVLKVYVNDLLFTTRTNVNSSTYSDLRIGAIYLLEGNNEIKIEAEGTMYLSKLNFNSYTVSNMTKNESEDEPVQVTIDDYVAEESTAAIEGVHIGTSPFNTATYSFDLEEGKAGLYKFDALYTTNNSNRTFTVTFDEDKVLEHTASKNPSSEERYIGDVYLEEGTHKFSIVNGDGLWSQYISFKLTPIYTGMNYIASYGNDENLLNGSLVKRGIDTIDIYYDNDVDIESATGENIFLKEKETQETVNCSYIVDSNKLSVKLKETLSYDTTYELFVENIENPYQTAEEERIIEFTTGDSSDDEGRGFTTVTESDVFDDHAIITGVVTYEADYSISGRIVTLYNELSSPIASAISEENGIFTLDYDMTDFEMGRYNYTVKDEYSSLAAPVEIVYYNDGDKQDLCGAFLSLTEASDIKSKLEEYEIVLGVDCSADETVLTNNGGNADFFFGHFANKTFNDVGEVEAFYNKALNYETIVQAVDETMVLSVLDSDDKIATLGIDKKVTDKITGSNRTAFISKVLAIPDTRDMDIYMAALNTEINNALAMQYSKTSAIPSLSDINVNVGQAAEIPIKFTQELSDVKKIDFVINVSGAEEIGNINLVVPSGYKGTSNKNENQIIGSIESEETITEDEFATLYVTIPKAGSYSMQMAGKITYIVDEIEITVEIPSVNATISAKQSNSSSGGGSVSSGGGKAGGGSYVDFTNKGAGKTQTSQVPQIPVESEYKFNDLSNVSWAENYIYDLVDKGIISKTETKVYNPQRATTREEFVKMIVIAMEIESDAECDFDDVKSSDWFYKYVAAAKSSGIINGIGNNKFGTGMNISRQDLSRIIKNILQIKGIETTISKQEKYADDDAISEYAKDAVYLMRELGIMEGIGDNIFAPEKTATRAEVAVVISRVMEVVNK